MSTSQVGGTDSARTFLASGQAAQVHRAWDATNCTYDPVQDKYVPSKPQSIRTVAAGPTTHFLKVMEAFQKTFPDNDSLTKFNIRDSHSWEEVLLTAGMAGESYKAQTRGFKGLFKKIGRKVGDVNPTVSPFLSTLPQGEYTSVVCGGIILIFNAFKRMSDVREKVMERLGDAPQLLEQVESFVRLYPEDQKLNESAIKLYISLLVAVEGIIKWFDHRSWDRLKAFMQQGLYARGLDEKLEFLDTCVDNMRTQADICDKEKTVEISEAIKIQLAMIGEVQELVTQKGNENLVAIADLTSQVGGGFDTVRDDVGNARNDISDSIEGISRKLSDRFGDMQTNMNDSIDGVTRDMNDSFVDTRADMKGGFAQMDIGMRALQAQNDDGMSRITRHMKEQINALNSINKQLSSDHRVFEWQREAERQQEKVRSLEQQLQQALTHTFLEQPEVLRLLGNISRVGIANIEHYVRVASAIDANPELTDAIMSTPKFRFWLTSVTSQVLFVDPGAEFFKVSPGTFVTASLGQIILDMPPAITLAHFCRGHVANADYSDPASSLMANLIAQLLAVREWDLRSWSEKTSTADHYEALETREIGYLCSFFKHLVYSLPYGTIFCLVDDFFHLEHHTDAESLSSVIRAFSDLVQSTGANGNVIFKALIMTPDRKGNVFHYANEADLLSLGMSKTMNAGGQTMTPKQQRFQLEFARRKGGVGPMY